MFNVPTDQRRRYGAILLIVLVLLLAGAVPSWPYSRSWGYRPVSIVGVLLFILLLLLVFDLMPWGYPVHRVYYGP